MVTLRRRKRMLLMAVAFHSPYDTNSLLLWRSSRKRFGNNRLLGDRRKLPYSLHRLFETENEANTHKQPPSGTTKLVLAENASEDEKDYAKLYNDNIQLRETVEDLEEEVKYLRLEASQRKIILESFEGENRFTRRMQYSARHTNSTTDSASSDLSLWCDQLEDEACPIEPSVSFGEALRDRALWLVGLLMVQSFSGIILAHNEALLTKHPVIIYYLTMLVGAGGNAGNQASVRVIRGLALGTLNEQTQSQFLTRELKMAFALSAILSFAGFLRTLVFRTPLPEIVAVTTSLSMIVLCSVCLGAVLPIGLKRIGVDPAHSSTSIQVLMDILGVVLAVVVSSFLLDSPFGKFLISRLLGL